MLRGLALVGVLGLFGSVAQAAQPSIAIMPLRDLAGGRANVGAALRETLTVDLRGTPNLKVIEREAIDRVLREQSVDLKSALEGVLGARVGTLLGASHLVTGAYQRQGGTLRVTVRVIAVETGLVVGSAKVDGELEKMLELEDRVSADLLRSVGWKPPRDAPPVARRRPRLSGRSIERFGDAQLEPDPEKKKVILRDVVKDAPQFSYAVDALAALEGRLARYEATSAVKLTEQEKSQLAIAADGKRGAGERIPKITSLLAGMRNQRRYHALLSACDALGNAPSEARDEIQYHRFLALEGLRRVDEALAAGEKLVADFASSSHFADTETRMRNLAQVRRTLVERKADYDKDLKEKLDGLGGKPPADPAKRLQWDWAPCIAARWNRQLDQKMVDGCRAFVGKYGEEKSGQAAEFAKNGRLFVILALGELGRWQECRKEIAEYRDRYPMGDDELDKKIAEWPTD